MADVIQSGVIKATCLRINLHNGITWLYPCLCLVTFALTRMHIFAISSSSLLLCLNRVITVQRDVVLVPFNCEKTSSSFFFLKNLKQQMLPENKLGCFWCSKIEWGWKDNRKIWYSPLIHNNIAEELVWESEPKKSSFPTKVKTSFENNRTSGAVTEATSLRKSNTGQWNKNLPS